MKHLFLLMVTTLAGCAPWPTTKQPEVDILVVDEKGEPIKGALVLFANYKVALTPEVQIVTTSTDERGRVHLEQESYVQMIFLAPDGGHSYDWSYCIQKAGYRATVRNSLSMNHFVKDGIEVTMLRSGKREECKWQEFPHGFVVATLGP
jgi:hypothetical protein